jgi:hypothetical protein
MLQIVSLLSFPATEGCIKEGGEIARGGSSSFSLVLANTAEYVRKITSPPTLFVLRNASLTYSLIAVGV